MKKVRFPCVVAGKDCEIISDVVSSEIPLLLSNTSMKRARVKLNLEKDCASIFGRDVKLNHTKSGHYYVPIVDSGNEPHKAGMPLGLGTV